MEIKVECNDNFFTYHNDNNNFQSNQFQNVLILHFLSYILLINIKRLEMFQD